MIGFGGIISVTVEGWWHVNVMHESMRLRCWFGLVGPICFKMLPLWQTKSHGPFRGSQQWAPLQCGDTNKTICVGFTKEQLWLDWNVLLHNHCFANNKICSTFLPKLRNRAWFISNTLLFVSAYINYLATFAYLFHYTGVLRSAYCLLPMGCAY